MDFRLDESIREQMKTATSRFGPDYWREISLERRFPEDYWKSLANCGLFGIMIEKEWGGLERGLVDLIVAVEETARHYSGIASYLFLSGALVSSFFSANGSQAQKEEFLPKLAKGELKISIALGEEESGFDVTSIKTTAVRNGEGEFVINGAKAFVNNVDEADYLILFARTTPVEKINKKTLGISIFVVDTEDPAIRSKELQKAGWDFVHNFSLEIKGLKVKSSQALGDLEKGWYNSMTSFNMDRVATAASLVGTGRLALDHASLWARERMVFGKPIGSNQGVQFPLADALARLETSWIMTLKAASLADHGKNYLSEANYSLLTASDAAMIATDRALQTFGGHGYYKEYDVERYWRDVRVHKIHPISEELLLASISEYSLGLPRSY